MKSGLERSEVVSILEVSQNTQECHVSIVIAWRKLYAMRFPDGWLPFRHSGRRSWNPGSRSPFLGRYTRSLIQTLKLDEISGVSSVTAQAPSGFKQSRARNILTCQYGDNSSGISAIIRPSDRGPPVSRATGAYGASISSHQLHIWSQGNAA